MYTNGTKRDVFNLIMITKRQLRQARKNRDEAKEYIYKRKLLNLRKEFALLEYAEQ